MHRHFIMIINYAIVVLFNKNKKKREKITRDKTTKPEKRREEKVVYVK